jgi:hypothetical protein
VHCRESIEFLQTIKLVGTQIVADVVAQIALI